MLKMYKNLGVLFISPVLNFGIRFPSLATLSLSPPALAMEVFLRDSSRDPVRTTIPFYMSSGSKVKTPR
jgi:hypothetical protein